jgi:hypothetical protein
MAQEHVDACRSAILHLSRDEITTVYQMLKQRRNMLGQVAAMQLYNGCTALYMGSSSQKLGLVQNVTKVIVDKVNRVKCVCIPLDHEGNKRQHIYRSSIGPSKINIPFEMLAAIQEQPVLAGQPVNRTIDFDEEL